MFVTLILTLVSCHLVTLISETQILWLGYSELIIFPIELHSDSTLFGAEGFISGYGWASKFCFNSKPRLSIAK